MSKYQCPDCEGKFDNLAKWSGGLVCPWCYREFLRHHSDPEMERQIMEDN